MSHRSTEQINAEISAEVHVLIEKDRSNLRSLFRQMREMMCILSGPDHIFEFMNDAHIKVLGFDATGMSVREAQPESVEIHDILDTVYRTGATADLFEIPVTLSGRVRHFNLTYAARRDMQGQINGVMILGSEITDQFFMRETLKGQNEALRESERRYRISEEQLDMAVRVSKIGFYDWDILNDRIVMSPQMSADWGFRAGAAPVPIDQVLRRIHPEDQERTWRTIQETIRNHIPFYGEYRVVHLDGRVLWAEVRGQIHYNGEGHAVRFFGTCLDVTERKNNEGKMWEAQMLAESASAAKTAFLTNMSHEIRTPLGAILGFLDLLKNPQLCRQDLEKYIGIIDRNSQQLLRLIDDILDLSKVEAGKLLIESVSFSLPELLLDFTSLMSLRAKEKGIVFVLRLDSRIPEFVNGDPTRLRQILSNIVGNAIKFTEKGHVLLSVAMAGAILKVVVEDTGRGITSEQRNILFQPFSQADVSTTRLYGGSGLGLVLTRRLTEAMGGSFVLEHSEPGEGSRFAAHLSLGLVENNRWVSGEELGLAPRNFSAPQDDVDCLKGLRVLVVDDAPDNQTLVGLFLKRWGVDSQSAANGREALSRIADFEFDLILMDIQMPVMDGHEATSRLRASNYQKPIIALTAHAMSEERERCRISGFSAYMTKPLQKESLRQLLIGFKKSGSASER